jgi:tripartite-type tricarboxylate transporter receptor subunit TctC
MPETRRAGAFARLLTLVAGLLAILAAPATVRAQDWPQQPITIVACFPPGGGTDAMARFVNTPLGDALGKPVIVENRAGASGNIAIQYVARAPADGYTILACSSSYVTNPSLLAGATYDPIKDFIPLMLVGASPNIFVVPGNSPHKTMQDLIAFAKANPGKINWTSAGRGTTAYLGGEFLKQQLGIDMVHVPFAGAGPASQATIAGQVDLNATAYGSVAAFIASGQMRVLATQSVKRIAQLPDVPSMGELGVKGEDFETFQSLFLPAGTPKPIVDKLAGALTKLLADPALKEKIERTGLPVLAQGPDAFKARIAREVPFYKGIIDRGNLKAAK